MNWEVAQTCEQFTPDSDYNFRALGEKLRVFSNRLHTFSVSVHENNGFRRLLKLKARFWYRVSEQFIECPDFYSPRSILLLLSELITDFDSSGRHKKFLLYLFIVNKDLANLLARFPSVKRSTLALHEILCLVRLEALTNN